MTILAAAADRPVGSDGPLVTVQCDVCLPPIVVANSRRLLREHGWLLADDGGPLDVCPVCRRRRSAGELLPRRETARNLPRGDTLPNLVIIGSAKCGTTSLHAYLDEHPDVSMSSIKEVQFFQDPNGTEWLDHYKSLFDSRAKVTGEASPLYTRLPIPGIPQRMAALVPDAKLIYMVRDPIERAISWYIEERQHDAERRTIGEVFADPADPANTFVYGCRYADRLAEFTAVYDMSQVLVVDLDDLQGRPVETMNRVFTFLGVEPLASSIEMTPKNTREEKREYSPAARRLRSMPLLKALYKLPPETREKLTRPLQKVLSRRLDRPELSAELRNRLATVLAPDTAELRRMTGQDFAGWSV